MRGYVRALVFASVVGCGGAATQGTVTVTPQPAPPATTATQPAPAATGALPQPAPPVATTAPCKRPLAGTPICFDGGQGTSVKDAVVIKGAHGESDGVAAEYKYLELLYGPRNSGYTVDGQSLLSDGGKPFDRLDIRVAGKRIAVYFDISDYFGKL